MQYLLRLVLFLGIALNVACDRGPKSAAGFRLPDGEADKGQALFVEFECTACHTISGLELAAPTEKGPVTVKLGGAVSRVQTYGDLVTSVINPSHRLAPRYPVETVSTDGESLMRNYNDVLTVQQLVDLVAFLQSQYDVVAPPTRFNRYAY